MWIRAYWCSQAFTCRCENVDMWFWYKFVRMCTQLSACSIICMCFWVRKCACVGCNPSWSGTTQQLVQRPFILLQLVQLLRTDKQDLELWATKHRPPTPLLKPLWPNPVLWLGNGQTHAYKQTNCQVWEEVFFFLKRWRMDANSNLLQKQNISMFFCSSTDCEEIGHLGCLYWISTKFCSPFHNKPP